jgi:hypothetical protein
VKKRYRIYVIGNIPPDLKEQIIALHAACILNGKNEDVQVSSHDSVAHYKDALEEKLSKSAKGGRINSRKHQ